MVVSVVGSNKDFGLVLVLWMWMFRTSNSVWCLWISSCASVAEDLKSNPKFFHIMLFYVGFVRCGLSID